MESEKKGRKEGDSESGVVYHLWGKKKREEKAPFTRGLQRSTQKNHDIL